MTPTTYKTYQLGTKKIAEVESEPVGERFLVWPCNSCGVTYDVTPLKTKIDAGRGIRIMPGYTHPKEIDTPTLKVKVIETKSGFVTIVTKHVKSVSVPTS